MTGPRRVTAGAVELSVVEVGEGGRPLLVVHGFTGSNEDFAGTLPGLAEAGWHVVAPDLRGHGASDQPTDEGQYSLGLFTADLFQLADTMGWKRFAVMGHSMGGMVAQVMALTHPERVTALVLLGTGHGPVEGIEPALVEIAVGVARTQGMASLAELIEAYGADPFESPARRRLLDELPDYAEQRRRRFLATSPHMFASMAEQLVGPGDRLDDLAGLDVATLVIVGAHDRSFLEPCRRIAAAVPGARLVVIDEGGHHPHLECPHEWTAALHDYLRDLPA